MEAQASSVKAPFFVHAATVATGPSAIKTRSVHVTSHVLLARRISVTFRLADTVVRLRYHVQKFAILQYVPWLCPAVICFPVSKRSHLPENVLHYLVFFRLVVSLCEFSCFFLFLRVHTRLEHALNFLASARRHSASCPCDHHCI